MGITIFYKGKLASTDNIEPLVTEVADICDTLKWPYHTLDEDFDIPFSARIRHTQEGVQIDGHLPIKGISFQSHKDSEYVTLMFDREGYLRMPISLAFDGPDDPNTKQIFVKTQYAGVDAHITTVKLLKYLFEKYFGEVDVSDEAEYWEKGDRAHTEQKFALLNSILNRMEKVLDEAGDSLTSDSDSTDEIADKLEKLIEDKWEQIAADDQG
ncbi:MAG: hypothetical protein GF398_09585 [Chitinivibrionales bacterium]|nr:hypothetical protein [Chitinivibrionales bacterium]